MDDSVYSNFYTVVYAGRNCSCHFSFCVTAVVCLVCGSSLGVSGYLRIEVNK